MSQISEEDKSKIKKMSRSEFIGNTHHFLGRGLRNDWNLWYNDNDLTKYFSSIDINHGDDRSGIILDSVYRTLLGLDIDLQGQIEGYKKHWREAGFKDGIHPPVKIS